uniref:(+)-delta-cadinene synthase n=1 Tax=Daphne genkwa TaxID=1477590 RepID=A0A977LFQ0_9ROSI|nr:terpene synthase 2 [Daphne genkwa]
MACFPAPAFPLNLCTKSKINNEKSNCSRASVLLGTDQRSVLVRRRCICAKETHPARPLANFHHDIWGDRFLTLPHNGLANEKESLEHEKRKEEVRRMIVEAITNPSRNLDLVDSVIRLGISYHFEEEINEFMQKLVDNLDECVTNNAENLHRISLCFRLLRQQGHRVSCEIFSNFTDEEGNLKEALISDDDRGGILSLYEAAHFRVHGEDVLEKALSFSVAKLTSMANNEYPSSFFTAQINHAMRFPIRKAHPRVHTRFYISTYEHKPSHNSWLLRFSKLDFNVVQKQHQMELTQVSRWWKEFDGERKFPYTRNRIVEIYFWMMLNYFEPKYGFGRVMTTKAIALTSVKDDTYDAYGTYEELKLLTEAIERWDPDMANQLPAGYIKNFYIELLDLYCKIEEEMVAHGTSHNLQYVKEEVKRMAKAYFKEVEWAHKKYTPSLKEYMAESGLVTSGCRHVWTLALVGIVGEIVNKEVFEWLSSTPKILEASSIICRYADDIPDYKFDEKRGNISKAVECCMKQYEVASEEAINMLSKQMDEAWKDMNEGCLSLPKSVPMSLVMPLINYVRLAPLFFHERDAYTHPEDAKEFLNSILLDPIPY